jgi:glycosyltransferase involved in cell wall biosynthesis
LNYDAEAFEVIFIDDCSDDGTYGFMHEACARRENWRIFRLEENSGSPSRPRNKGIQEAKGEYIYFLDCDDEILPDALSQLWEMASKTDACVVRSELLAYDGRQHKLMNKIDAWCNQLSKKQKVSLIIGQQSTVPTSLVRAQLLRKHNIEWPELIRMGEDTIFLAYILTHAKNIEYLAAPTYIYFKIPALTPASTQRYGSKELGDHLEVWESTQSILSSLGLNYIQLRLKVGLRVVIESLIYRNRGDIDTIIFQTFSDFVNRYWSNINQFNYTARIKDIVEAIRSASFNEFINLIKPRLLIAGYDLKFIKEARDELSKYFNIEYDEWRGHETHHEEDSYEHLQWADFIWCEWLLGNAEWYSKRKMPHQRLIIRVHRMELGRDYGDKIAINNVDAFIIVSVFFFERLIERFPSIPRNKVHIIDNFIRTDAYDATFYEDRLCTLAMIGILPSQKGYRAALEILADLKKFNDRFKIKIFGKRPEDLHWIANNTVEMKYYSECENYILKNKLGDAVEFVGHVDVKVELARQKVGYVLSLSEPDLGFPGFESFHLAIADGFAGGCISLVKRWPGAEYIWGEECIFEESHEIVEAIKSISQSRSEFDDKRKKGIAHVRRNYDIDIFVRKVRDLFMEIL